MRAEGGLGRVDKFWESLAIWDGLLGGVQGKGAKLAKVDVPIDFTLVNSLLL
jgi:hypothetical protein